MKSTRAEYEPWLRDYLRKRYPDLEPAILAAIDAFDTIKIDKRLNQELLAPIVEAASSSRRPLYENATGFLAKLTGDYAEAHEAVAKMSQDSRSHVRFNSLLCLAKATPLAFTLRLIRQGLQDKSSIVRQKAADWAGRLRLREVVLDLEEAFGKEQNAKVKATIEFELKLLRDGYILKPDPDGGFWITAFTPNGTGSRRVEQTEFERRGIQAIVAEIAVDPLG
jgi:hypothetical protein